MKRKLVITGLTAALLLLAGAEALASSTAGSGLGSVTCG